MPRGRFHVEERRATQALAGGLGACRPCLIALGLGAEMVRTPTERLLTYQIKIMQFRQHVYDAAEVEPFDTPQRFVISRYSIISMKRWRTDEVLEQVAYAGGDAEAIAKAVIGWANSHSCIQIRGGRGRADRALTMYADSGRGKGVLSLYAAENGGGPMLELRIEQICSMPPYDSGEAHTQLTADLRALGIPRLDAEEIRSAIRPNIPLDQLTGGRLERLLSLLDRCIE